MYSIQHYVIQVVNDLRQDGGFLRVLRFPPPKKIDRRDIAKILLKVALNTITLTITMFLMCYYFRMRRNRGCFQFNNKDYRKSKLSERISIRQKMYMAN